LEDIQRGEQIYDSYGKKCNTRFLLNYGFINLNNDGNEYPFKVNLDPSDPHFAAKNELLGTALNKRTYRVMADLTETSTFKWLSWCRYVVFEGDMMLLAQMKIKDQNTQNDSSDEEPTPSQYKAENIGIISISNEKKVLQFVHKQATDCLKLYPDSLQTDMQILAKDDETHSLSFNERNCVLFRSGEKEILHFYIEFTEYMSSLLGMKFKDAKKET
jgi:histone-lysine N-methyltransferase SETD3